MDMKPTLEDLRTWVSKIGFTFTTVQSLCGNTDYVDCRRTGTIDS